MKELMLLASVTWWIIGFSTVAAALFRHRYWDLRIFAILAVLLALAPSGILFYLEWRIEALMCFVLVSLWAIFAPKIYQSSELKFEEI